MLDDVETPGDLSQPTDDTTPTTDKVVPLSALQAERERVKAVKAELDAIKAAQAEADRKAAEQSGEYERLYRETLAEVEGLRPLREKLTAIEHQQAAARDARWLALPDAMRAVRLDGLTAEQDEQLLSAQEAIAKGLGSQPKADTTGRSPVGGGGDPGQLTEAERSWREKQSWIPDNASPEVVRKAYRKRNPST